MKINSLFFMLVICIVSFQNESFSQWQQHHDINGGTVWDLEVIGTDLFAATSGGIYRSTNNGTIWVKICNGIDNQYIAAVESNGNTLYAATTEDYGELGGGVYHSTDFGNTWVLGNTGFSNLRFNTLFYNNGYLHAGTVGLSLIHIFLYNCF